jgi:hypothetical protein
VATSLSPTSLTGVILSHRRLSRVSLTPAQPISAVTIFTTVTFFNIGSPDLEIGRGKKKGRWKSREAWRWNIGKEKEVKNAIEE